MDGEPLGKKTLLMVGILVGAAVAFMGTTSTAAVLITAKVVGTSGESSEAAGAKAPSAAPSARPAAPKKESSSPML